MQIRNNDSKNQIRDSLKLSPTKNHDPENEMLGIESQSKDSPLKGTKIHKNRNESSTYMGFVLEKYYIKSSVGNERNTVRVYIIIGWILN